MDANALFVTIGLISIGLVLIPKQISAYLQKKDIEIPEILSWARTLRGRFVLWIIGIMFIGPGFISYANPFAVTPTTRSNPTAMPAPSITTPISPTVTPVPLTNTPLAPNSMPESPTVIPAPPTNTLVPPTKTPIPPTRVPPTVIPAPPTNTPVPPTRVPPTRIPVPPTRVPIVTNTLVPPTVMNTPVPPNLSVSLVSPPDGANLNNGQQTTFQWSPNGSFLSSTDQCYELVFWPTIFGSEAGFAEGRSPEGERSKGLSRTFTVNEILVTRLGFENRSSEFYWGVLLTNCGVPYFRSRSLVAGRLFRLANEPTGGGKVNVAETNTPPTPPGVVIPPEPSVVIPND